MALGPKRVTRITESPFPHEKAGQEAIRLALPDVDPYHLWTNALLVDGSRSYEIDAIVIGKHCLYVLELKAWEGEIRGDVQDWYVLHRGREKYHPNPLRLLEIKAKVIKSRLQAKLGDRVRLPWVEPLVFLHGKDVKLRFDEHTRGRVVVGDAIGAALTMRKYDGAPSYTGEPINRPLMEELKRGIRALGLKASEKNNRVGDYRIVGQLEDGELYQDLLVAKPDLGGRDVEYRLRVFPTELETEPTRRAQLERAAVREERGLRDVSGHPYVLQAQPGFPTPRGPAIPMEYVPDAVTLFTWVESRPGASLELRLRVLQQLCEAVGHCHSRRVLHRNLSPGAVLVSGGDDPHVHLRNFVFAQRLGSQATLTTATCSDRERLYRAPEAFVAADAAQEPADVFSLGAIAFFVLSGRDPARDLRERQAVLQAGRGLRLGAVLDAFVGRRALNELGTGAEIEEVVATATDEDPQRRWPSATEFQTELLSAATTTPAAEETPLGPAPKINPLQAKPGDELGPDLVVERVLGSGATSKVYLVKVGDARRVLKVARDARAAEFLRGEARTLENLKHQRIVALKRPIFSVGDHEALLLDMAGETTLSQYLRDEGAATLDFAARWGRELLETVQYLEERGTFHRDLKPANVGLEVVGKKQQKSILLFDFSHSHLPLSTIEAGTEAYRDPHLVRRESWDHHAEHYSAALVLYELLTGTLPRRPRTPSEPAAIAPEALIESCRERLAAFFQRAFAVDAADRFPSAAEMLQAWIEATSTSTKASRGRRSLDDAAPDTPIYELPLSESARNALDRNRVYTAGELARLPRNRLLILKGVGRKTAHELADVAQRLRDRFHVEASTPLPEPLVPDYPPEPRALAEDPGPLPPEAVQRLAEAEITNDVQLAGYSREDLVEVLGEDLVTAVKSHLEQRRKKLGRSPATLAGWVEEARRGLPKNKKDRALLERLLGLQAFGDFGPTEAPTQVELARATEGVSQAKLSRLLLNARHHWLESHLNRLVARLAHLTHAAGGALTLPSLARRLVEDVAPLEAAGTQGPAADTLRQAAFLVRVACETAGDQDPPPLRRRLRSGREIVEAVDDQWTVLLRLVAKVDSLAGERPLPSLERTLAVVEDEVLRLRLNARLSDSPPPEAGRPDDAPPDRSPAAWLRLAVELSEVAALSRRGEVYPRDLEPMRQVELLQPALPPQFSPDDLRALARERYPAAAVPLPDDVAKLRELLEPRGWVWHEAMGAFARRQETFVTQYRSSVPTTPRALARPSLDADRLDVELVSERIVSAARERTFRALMVAPQRVDGAIARLCHVVGQATGHEPSIHSVDLQLARHMRRLVDSDFPGQGLWDEVLRADALGPDVTGPERESWDELVRYGRRASEALLEDLATTNPPGRAIVLRDLGLVVRFGLAGFLDQLVARIERDERLGSVFLVVIQTEALGTPRLLDVLDVPATPGQALRLHKAWVDGEQTGRSEAWTLAAGS